MNNISARAIFTNILFILSAIIMGGVLTAPFNFLYPDARSIDHDIFMIVAQVFVNGGEIYIDAWDHKGPLLTLIYALAYIITPSSKIGLLVLCSINAFFILKLNYSISKLYLSSRSSLILVLLTAPLLYSTLNGQPSDWVLTLQITTLYLFLKKRVLISETLENASAAKHYIGRLISWKGKDGSLLFIFGLFSAITFYIKFNLCIFWAPFLIYETLYLLMARGFKICARGLFSYVISCMLVTLFVATFTNMSALWENYIKFNIAYANDAASILPSLFSSSEHTLNTFSRFIVQLYTRGRFMGYFNSIFPYSTVLLVLFLLFGYSLFWPRKKGGMLTLLCMFSSCLLLFFAVFKGSLNLHYYYYSFIAFYICSLAAATKYVLNFIGRFNFSKRFFAFGSIILCLITCEAWRRVYNSTAKLTAGQKLTNENLNQHILGKIQNDRSVLFIGNSRVLVPRLNISIASCYFYQPVISIENWPHFDHFWRDQVKNKLVRHIVIDDYSIRPEMDSFIQASGYVKEIEIKDLSYYRLKED